VSPRRRLCLFGGRTNHRARGESSRQRSTDHVHGGVSEGGGPIASASTVTLPPMSFITRRAAPHSSSYCVSKSSRPLRRSAGSSSWRYLGGQEILERQGAVGAEAEVQRRPHEADLREPDVPREEPERGEAQVERVPAEERGAVTVSDPSIVTESARGFTRTFAIATSRWSAADASFTSRLRGSGGAARKPSAV
jgi:hypothetical protein